MGAAIQLFDCGRHYATAAGRFVALAPTRLEFETGTYSGIIGPSGSGKSTLLNLVSGIDRPTTGQVLVGGQDITALSETRLAAFRGRNIGFVFQFFQLLPTLTALENLRLAMDLVGSVPKRRRRDRAQELLERVGVDRHADKLPAELSGGEQQRVAIARALANDPGILVADEPTGNLDGANAAIVENIFRGCVREGRTVLVATHDTADLGRFDRVVRLAEGRVVDETAAVEA